MLGITTQWWVIVLGTLINVAFGVLLAFGGRRYWRYQKVAFAFAGLGQLLVGWRPRVAVVALSAIAVYSYFVLSFAAVFDWPQWVLNTSAFSLYGSPMTKVDWGGIATLIAVGVASTAAALVAMRRRDVGA